MDDVVDNDGVFGACLISVIMLFQPEYCLTTFWCVGGVWKVLVSCE